MKIYHFSDTHTKHYLLNVPKSDISIFSGDCSNPKNLYRNEQEVREFIEWYKKVDSTYKIFVAGNHDLSIERKWVTRKDFEEANIIYLENESVTINNLNIFGTPITPTFGIGWAFNKARHKMHQLWESVPVKTDIIISHGPPKNILDLSYNLKNELESCGCTAFLKLVLKLNLKACLFGHIHNHKDLVNAGIKKINGKETIFSNGSCAYDGKIDDDNYFNQGNLIEL